MLLLAIRNLIRRPLRTGLTAAGLAAAVAVLVCIWSFGNGYKRALGTELERMGMHLMLVPLGCPYDAAARVLKGKTLENSLPESALQEARRDSAVAVAAPLLMAALPRPETGRADMWVGLDQSALALKPWWKTKEGTNWFLNAESTILGVDAAEAEMRAPGDWLYSPETGQKLQVAGILERSGTSDDSLFFVPLATAQRMLNQPGRLTAIALRLKDPSELRAATERLQRIPGAQVVTLTEMMGTFLNLVGAVRTLLLSIAVLAIAISGLSVFNTIMAAVVERTCELSVMRAIGASRYQVMRLIVLESVILASAGTLAGLGLAVVAGSGIENAIRQITPLAPAERLLSPTMGIVLQTALLGIVAGGIGGLLPAWRASRLQPAQALNAE
jgi:putative ABC transport system permease protein